MPSNIQYNTPMPIYSREAAEEQYKQQIGAGPDHALGASDRHFNPEMSETLKAIRAGENDTFGQHFNEMIAQAEIPHIPPAQEPYWAHTARNRSERPRSATPSAAQPYYSPHYSTLQRSKNRSEERSNVPAKIGYEFGGLDYVDKSRIPQDSSYIYFGDTQRNNDEQKTTIPGYEMGGMDFRKGAIGMNGPYHGHGPEQRRLHPKFDHASLKRDEMNIEIAPNVDHVSADILIGDTRSNQHLTRNELHDHSFGTSFGPTVGFTRQHRTVTRQEEAARPTTFSLSAKKDNNSAYRQNDTFRTRDTYSTPPSHETLPPSTDLAGFTSQTVTNYASTGTTGRRTDIGVASVPYVKTEQPWIRMQSKTAPTGRTEWANGNVEKEVTIETLLNDKALIAQKRSMTPEWQSRSFEKHNQWKNRSDPRLARSQTYDHQPTWSRIVSDRRNIWEDKARNTDARIQMPPSSKIPPQQPPFWCSRADQTHALWQSEADRQNRDGYGSGTQTNYNYAEYREEQRKHEKYDMQKRGEGYGTATDARPTGDYDGFVSQTQYATHTGGPENVQRNQPQYHTSYSSNQQQYVSSEHGIIPAKQGNHLNYAPVPIGSSHPISSGTQQQSSTWQSQSSSSRYEQKVHERATERMISSQPVNATAISATNPADTYAIQKTSYQRKTHHETAAPYNTSVVSVTQGTGNFNRRAEMSETLPRGTIANTEASLQGNYVDKDGQPVSYKREIMTSVNPNSESTLLKEEEKRIIETPLEPGVISR
uniref:ZM domain-containing protein n=1 Tax=Onchocerca volvulus TaxID=6282 RepID=A0A8R1TTA2_ONCVO